MNPTATLSLDLDDVWAYLRAQGKPEWTTAPTLLATMAERLDPLLRELGLRITVFVVGRDLEQPAARAVVTALADAGHEIGSHSLEHYSNLATRPVSDIADDLARTAERIANVVGKPPRGFRCPSFGVSADLLSLLARNGYAYDASLLPTSIGPLLRRMHRATMSEEVRRRESHSGMYGGVGNGFMPLKPFRWQTASGSILELPITTFPLLRVPLHMSYLHALGTRAEPLAHMYFDAALLACRARGIAPSFLLHPPDLLDAHDAPALAYFAGMARPWRDKVAHVRHSLQRLVQHYRVVSLGVFADELAHAQLPTRTC